MGVQNITENRGYNTGAVDPDWVQLKGWSAGIIVNYPIKFGKDKVLYAYGSPTILNHNVNLHFGLRSILLSIDQAKGGMVELGLSYTQSLFISS